MRLTDWAQAGRAYCAELPKLAFPLVGDAPEFYVPQRTILRMSDGAQMHTHLWCYLERKLLPGKFYQFNPSSLSAQRVKDMSRVIERLSKRFRFDNARPRTVTQGLHFLASILNWLDEPNHQGRYEAVLSDPDLALEALKQHHSYVRQRMQANRTGNNFGQAAASNLDTNAIKMMSVVHDREYGDEIEPIPFFHSEGVKPPKTESVAGFMACLQGVFDSVTEITLDAQLDARKEAPLGALRWDTGEIAHSVEIPPQTRIERLMELGCVAYAGLCLGDSGANLAAIQSYEEPEDMQEQLANPEKINLRHKVIKFRAGGKEVPVHLTVTTFTRLRSYLRLREALRLRLGCQDISPMFIQTVYGLRARTEMPLGITPLGSNFTALLRRKFRFVGINLPAVTMQQLRVYKSGIVIREHNPKVAADMMGNSVSTAIRKYSKITEAESQSEVAPFLTSLTSVVRNRLEAEKLKSDTPLTAIPIGGCADHGHPRALTEEPLVRPDCKKTEGCFFCDKYHVHADEGDCIKLMSCRSVLERLTPGPGSTGAAERVYAVVIGRIGVLLNEMKRLNPEAHERARVAVEPEGRLSRYWSSKLQQLHLLGLLSPPNSRLHDAG